MARKYLFAALALGMLSAASAYGIDPGPGGRIYLSGRFNAGQNKYIRIKSFSLSADWSAGAVAEHGDISDMYDDGFAFYTGTDHLNNGIKPEILVSNPDGFATLMVSAFWKDGFLPGHDRAPAAGKWSSSLSVLGALSINPTTSGMDVSVLTPGRTGQASDLDTEGASWIIPDVRGSFTGVANSYIAGTPYVYNVMADRNGDGDIAGSDADYIKSLYKDEHQMYMRLYDGHLYRSMFFAKDFTRTAGIVTFDSDFNRKVFYESDDLFWSYASKAIAIGKVKHNGQSVDALYAQIGRYDFDLEKDVYGIKKIMDIDGDGVGDLTQDIYLPQLWDMSYFGEMQFITSGQGEDLKRFLMLECPRLDSLYVLELSEDGSPASGDNFRAIQLPPAALAGDGYNLGFWSFDAIPEPAGLVLLASGMLPILRSKRS